MNPSDVFSFDGRTRRLARDQDGGGDLAALECLGAVRLAHVHFDRLNAETFEDVARRELSAGADVAEIDALAFELLDRGDAGIRTDDEMHLLVVELGDVDNLVVDVADLARAAEGVQQIRLRDAEIDALEEANVADVLAAAFADHRQDAEIVAVIEHRG